MGRVVKAQHRVGVYRVLVEGSKRHRRVQRANLQGWWPKGARDRSPAAMRPLEASQ